jgi:hypothetical protein
VQAAGAANKEAATAAALEAADSAVEQGKPFVVLQLQVSCTGYQYQSWWGGSSYRATLRTCLARLAVCKRASTDLALALVLSAIKTVGVADLLLLLVFL